MGCLFVHDFRSYNKDGEVYTGNLSYEIWNERYIKYFGSIKVLNEKLNPPAMLGRLEEDVSGMRK